MIRSGFGIFYDYNTNLIQNSIRGFHYPFAVTRTVGGQNLLIPGPYNLASNPYAPFSPAIANLSGTVDLNRRDPYALEYNFGIQQMLTGNLLLEVDYVGTGGRKLVTNIQQNQALASPLPVNPRRPWPNTPTSFFLIADVQNSNYNSLQTKLERRYSSGLTFRNSYTWSKCLDIDSDPNSAVLDYSYNLKYSYGPCTFNIHHVDTADIVYLLPFGRGKKFGIASAQIRGWRHRRLAGFRSGDNPVRHQLPCALRDRIAKTPETLSHLPRSAPISFRRPCLPDSSKIATIGSTRKHSRFPHSGRLETYPGTH